MTVMARPVGGGALPGQRCRMCGGTFRMLERTIYVVDVDGAVVPGMTYLPGRIICDGCMTRSVNRINRHAAQCRPPCEGYPCQPINVVRT
jgi:hypothetical protein